MGIVSNIGFDRFPRQYNDRVGERVKVCFGYNVSEIVQGVIVRDDAEAPWRTIIRLEDGRHVLSTECMYSFDGGEGT